MAKKSDKLLILTFVLFLGGMMLLNILTPDRVFSLRENRYLAKRPELSLANLISGRFTRQFEEYVTDEFALRDQWVLLKADLEMLLLRRENNGIFFASGGYLLENFQPGPALERNIQQLNRFAHTYPDIKTHVLLAPNSVALYPHRLPPFAKVYDQGLVVEEVKSSLDNAKFIDVRDVLHRHREEYIYFRTDHHWTMRGAYYAYTTLARSLGLIPLSPAELETATISQDFWGTYFAKANNRYSRGDSIELLLPKTPVAVQVSFNDKAGSFNSLYFPQHLETRDQYAYFLDGNHPLTVIATENSQGGKLAVFKDSFAHALLPFLAQHYQEIHVIDLRFFNAGLGEYFQEHNIDQALFLYNVSGFSSDNSLINFRP